mgnify:CR=1 FL=1
MQVLRGEAPRYNSVADLIAELCGFKVGKQNVSVQSMLTDRKIAGFCV